jgi:hypothetical protein
VLALPHDRHPARCAAAARRRHDLVNLPLRWDAGWYISVARIGYMWTPRDVGRQQNVAFFPRSRWRCARWAGLFGGSGVAYLYGGLAVSHVAFLWR